MCVIRVPVELTGIPSTSHYISFLFIFVDIFDVVKPIIIIIIIMYKALILGNKQLLLNMKDHEAT